MDLPDERLLRPSFLYDISRLSSFNYIEEVDELLAGLRSLLPRNENKVEITARERHILDLSLSHPDLEFVHSQTYQNSNFPYLSCRPDGVLRHRKTKTIIKAVEIKGYGEKSDFKFQTATRWQIQSYMAVLEVDNCDLIIMKRNFTGYRVLPMHYD